MIARAWRTRRSTQSFMFTFRLYSHAKRMHAHPSTVGGWQDASGRPPRMSCSPTCTMNPGTAVVGAVRGVRQAVSDLSTAMVRPAAVVPKRRIEGRPNSLTHSLGLMRERTRAFKRNGVLKRWSCYAGAVLRYVQVNANAADALCLQRHYWRGPGSTASRLRRVGLHAAGWSGAKGMQSAPNPEACACDGASGGLHCVSERFEVVSLGVVTGAGRWTPYKAVFTALTA